MKVPDYLRPIVPVFVVIAGLMVTEFVLLVVGEWLDGNTRSLAIRLGGLVLTILVGFWTKRRFAMVQENIKKMYEAPPHTESSYTAEEIAAAVKAPPPCTGFEKVCDELAWDKNGRYCLRCLAAAVEKTLP